jgi:hypothetical protein
MSVKINRTTRRIPKILETFVLLFAIPNSAPAEKNPTDYCQRMIELPIIPVSDNGNVNERQKTSCNHQHQS